MITGKTEEIKSEKRKEKKNEKMKCKNKSFNEQKYQRLATKWITSNCMRVIIQSAPYNGMSMRRGQLSHNLDRTD